MIRLILLSLFFCNIGFAATDAQVFQEALRKNDLNTIHNLVKNNFDENQDLNSIKETPFTLTALNGNIQVLGIIAMPEKTKINHQTTNGWTALMFAARGGVVGGNYKKVVERLLAMGVDKTLKNKDGETALDIAKKAGAKEVIKLLE